jgi:alkyl sulfatase BDS1-like metallo-beta-lactamase superfamily hydrolase
MERMMEKEAKYLLPGHGKLIEGKKNVREVLLITVEAMHFVHDEVVKRLNEGKWFEQIYNEMIDIYPEKFKKHEYLQPLYGCYRFAIHAVYRLYHGWYDSGNPTDLFPSRSEDIATEFLKISQPEVYLNHAKNLLNQKRLQLALHIIDIVIKGNREENQSVYVKALKLKKKILKLKRDQEPSFIVSNIINNGIHKIKSKLRNIKNS